MISAGSILQQSNPFENSIQQLLRLDGLKKISLEQEIDTFNDQKKTLDKIGSSFSALQTILNEFSEPGTTSFQPMKAESTTNAVNVVSADGATLTGNFDITVDSVARRDTLTSAFFAQDGSTLAAQGSASFEISAGDSDPVVIAVDTTGKTDGEVLNALRDAVNEQFGDFATASTIQVSDTEFALSLKSNETGSANQITLQSVQGDALSLNLDRSVLPEDLDAQFTVDGISMTRSSNTIENAIEGVTFELINETDFTQQLSIVRDTEAAMESINSFVEAFNALNSEIRKATRLNGETGDRGILQRERSIRNLSNTMRQSVSLPVISMTGSGSGVQTLSDLGLTISQTGELSIRDSGKLEELLATSPDVVEEFFTADDGLVSNLKNGIERAFDGENNLIDLVKTGIDSRIDRTNNRIEAEERFLVRREEQLRKEFTRLNQVIEQGQTQFNQVLNFQTFFLQQNF
jgi:flagellar hook-associated protein 2